VGDLQTKFQNRIFSVIKGCYNIAKENPAQLVCILRIIENEEITNKSLKEKLQIENEKSFKR